MHYHRINTTGSRNKNDLAIYTHRRQIGQHHAKLEDKSVPRGLQHTVHSHATHRPQAAEIENHHNLNDTRHPPFLPVRGHHAQANYHPPVIFALQHQQDDYPPPQTLPQTYLSLAMYFANILPNSFPELAEMRFAKQLPRSVLAEKNESATQSNTASAASNLAPTVLQPHDRAFGVTSVSYHGNHQATVLHREDSQDVMRRAVRSANASFSTPLLSAPRSTTNFYAAPVTVFPGRSTTLAHANTITTMPAIASTMSPDAVHATTATAITASPMPLARALARDIFIAYTQLLVPTMNRQASLGEVFNAYLQYDQRYRRHHQETTATAADHPFMRDWELRRYVCDQLGWIDVDSSPIRSDIAHHLALSLVDVTNIKGAYIDNQRRAHQITYNGFSFRGFPDDTPIRYAKHRIVETLSGAAQNALDIDDASAKHFGLLLLSAIAPELSQLKDYDNDLAVNKMTYGDRQHALLDSGIQIASHFDFSSQQYNTTQLQQIAATVMNDTAIPLLDDGRISTAQANKGLAWSDAGLLFMANAQGAIDLSQIHQQNATTLTQQLERFVQREFKNELHVRDALATLKSAQIPTRKKIALAELTRRGINPARQIEVESTTTGLSTGAVAASRSSRRYNTTLVELWLNKHVETLPLVRQDIVHVKNRNVLNALPNLTGMFDQAFNTYRDHIAQHIGQLLAAELNIQTSKRQRENAFFSLWTVADHPGFGFREKPMQDKFFIEMWHGHDYAQKRREIFFYVEGNQADSLTLKPLNQTLVDWMDHALHQLKTGQRQPRQSLPTENIIREPGPLEAFFDDLGRRFATILRAMDAVVQGRLTATGGPAILRHEHITSKDINIVTRSAGDIFVQRHIDPLKARAYSITPTEEMIESTRDFLLPLYGPVKTFLNWHTSSQAVRLGSILGGLLECSAFIPGFYQLGKLGLSTTTLLAKTAQRGIGMAQRFGPKMGAKASLATLKAGTPKLARHSTQFVIETVDAFFPIGGLPRGGGKLRRADAIDLKQIAQEMHTSHPELAVHLNKLAHTYITKENNQWIATDPARIHYRHGPHYTIEERDYRVASLGAQEHVLLKKHTTTDGHCFTAVNPLQDQAYGPRLHLSEHGKLYLDKQATMARLHGYAVPIQNQAVKKDTALVSLTHAQHSYASLDGRQQYIQMGDATITADQPYHPYYLLEKTEEGHFYITHPAAHANHQTDHSAISPDRAKIAVEVIDGRWQLTLTEAPEQFSQLKGRETSTWQHRGRGEMFTVARLSDSDRVVALKAEGGKYREIDWATGKPRHDRAFIYKNSDGLYSYGALRGAGPKRQKGGTPSQIGVEVETVTVPGQRNSQQENIPAVVQQATTKKSRLQVQQANIAITEEIRPLLEKANTHQIGYAKAIEKADKMLERMAALAHANEADAWLKFSNSYVAHLKTMINSGAEILNMLAKIDTVTARIAADAIPGMSEVYTNIAKHYIQALARLDEAQNQLTQMIQALKPSLLALMLAEGQHRFFSTPDRPLPHHPFLGQLDLAITGFDVIYKTFNKQTKSYAELANVPYLRHTDSAQLFEIARQAENSMPARGFLASHMHIRLLEHKSDIHLVLRVQGKKEIENFVTIAQNSHEKHLFTDCSFVDAVINFKLQPHQVQALRRFDDRYAPQILSTDDQLRILLGLDEQYKEIALENIWLAEQCAAQGWLEEEHIYKKIAELVQERQTQAAKALDDFLVQQSQVSASLATTTGVAALARQKPKAARSDLMVIETELGTLAGKKKRGSANIVEIKDEHGSVLAEYEAEPTSSQASAAHRTWIRKSESQAIDSLSGEIAAFNVRQPKDLTKIVNKLNVKVDEWIPKAEQLKQEKRKYLSLANWMVEHPPIDATAALEPARIQKILTTHAKELSEHAGKIATIQKQFEQLNKKSPSAVPIKPVRDNVNIEALSADLERLSAELQQKGKECRVRLIKKQLPHDAGMRYLAELKAQGDPLAATFNIKSAKPRLGMDDGSYLDEYEITIDQNTPNWYAHFHYKNAEDSPEKYTAAHLKQKSERYFGKNWEKIQGMESGIATKIYRARIAPETAQSFFSAR